MADAKTGEGPPGSPRGVPRLALPRGRSIALDRCRVMGILNATPDSFSDGGDLDTDLAARLGEVLPLADVVDVGGESTRPGHTPVDAATQIERVVPVIRAVRRLDPDMPVSIDTRLAAVAEAALAAGADIVNDVSALGDPAMADVVRRHRCPVALMRHAPLEGPVVDACRAQIGALVARAEAGGVRRDQVVVDPGLGFGTMPGPDPAANLALVRDLSWADGLPVLVGASRKRFLGRVTGVEDLKARLPESLAVAVLAAMRGAAFVRVHDVAETARALAVVQA